MMRTFSKTFLKRLLGSVVVASAIAVAIPSSSASELVYVPISPSFGGSSFNDDFILNLLNIENKHLPDGGSGGDTSFPDINIDLGDLGGGTTIIIPTTTPSTTTQ